MKYQTIMSQGGSVAGFLVVGLILVSLAGGGVYFVQQRSAGEAKKPVDIVKTPASTEKKPDVKKNKPTPAPISSNESVVKSNNAATLPETGPADGPVGIIAGSLIVGFFVAYIQSRKYRFTWVQR